MSVNEIRDFIFENYYKRIEVSEEKSDHSRKHKKGLQFFVIKLTEKISHSCNAKEHYQSVIRKKNTKISRTVRNNYSATKNL